MQTILPHSSQRHVWCHLLSIVRLSARSSLPPRTAGLRGPARGHRVRAGAGGGPLGLRGLPGARAARRRPAHLPRREDGGTSAWSRAFYRIASHPLLSGVNIGKGWEDSGTAVQRNLRESSTQKATQCSATRNGVHVARAGRGRRPPRGAPGERGGAPGVPGLGVRPGHVLSGLGPGARAVERSSSTGVLEKGDQSWALFIIGF